MPAYRRLLPRARQVRRRPTFSRWLVLRRHCGPGVAPPGPQMTATDSTRRQKRPLDPERRPASGSPVSGGRTGESRSALHSRYWEPETGGQRPSATWQRRRQTVAAGTGAARPDDLRVRPGAIDASGRSRGVRLRPLRVRGGWVRLRAYCVRDGGCAVRPATDQPRADRRNSSSCPAVGRDGMTPLRVQVRAPAALAYSMISRRLASGSFRSRGA